MMGSRHAYLQFRSHINFISRISHTEEKGEVALAAYTGCSYVTRMFRKRMFLRYPTFLWPKIQMISFPPAFN